MPKTKFLGTPNVRNHVPEHTKMSKTDVFEHTKCQELMFLGTPKFRWNFSDSKSFSVPNEF